MPPNIFVVPSNVFAMSSNVFVVPYNVFTMSSNVFVVPYNVFVVPYNALRCLTMFLCCPPMRKFRNSNGFYISLLFLVKADCCRLTYLRNV